MYDDPISAKYFYLHPESQNLLQEDNHYITDTLWFTQKVYHIKMSIQAMKDGSGS